MLSQAEVCDGDSMSPVRTCKTNLLMLSNGEHNIPIDRGVFVVFFFFNVLNNLAQNTVQT